MNKKRKKRPKLPKPLYVFSFCSFFNDIGSDMVKAIWPLFINVFLGIDVVILGLIDGAGETAVFLSQSVSGYVSDKIGKRKPFIVFGYLFGAVSRLGYALSKTWPCVFLFHMVDRIGKMRETPRDVYLAEAEKKKGRGAAFGLLRAMDSLGALVGICLAIVLFPLIGYVGVLLFAAIPSLISVLLVWLFINERDRSLKRHILSFDIRKWRRMKKVFVFYVSGIFFGLALFTYSIFLLYTKATGTELYLVPVFYLIYTAVMSVSAYPLGKISDRIGRRSAVLLSYSLYLITLSGFAVLWAFDINYFLLLALMFVFYGLFKALFKPAYIIYTAEIAPKDYKATVLGGYRLILGITAFPASVIAGVLWETVGSYAPFLFGCACVIISGLILIIGDLYANGLIKTKKKIQS